LEAVHIEIQTVIMETMKQSSKCVKRCCKISEVCAYESVPSTEIYIYIHSLGEG